VLANLASYELSDQPGVGASGAIFGLFGVAIVFSLKYRRELPGQMGDRLLRSLVPVLLLNLVLTLSIPIIDKAAHLGGFIAGALLASLTESRTTSPERRKSEALPLPAALLTAVGLLAYGAWGLGSVVTASIPLFRASLAVQRNDTAGAIRILEPVARRHPDNVAAQELFAELLSKSGQGQQAEAIYRRLLKKRPNDPELLNALAYLYADVLNTHLDEAQRLAQRALANMPNDGNIVDTLAWIYYRQGKLKEAYATQQRAVRLESSQPDLRYHMGVIEEAMGHIPAAREEYAMALRLNPRMAEARQALERLNGRPTNPPRTLPPGQPAAAAPTAPQASEPAGPALNRRSTGNEPR
jgi:tetratricopeptide (TPR) repeat protein